MGLVATVVRVDEARLAAAVDAATVVRRSRGLFGRERLRARFDPALFDESLFGDGYDADRAADLDEAWHAIHVTLSGETDEAPMPGGFLLAGEPPGPAHVSLGESVGVHAPADAAAIADLLRDLPPDRFLARLDVADLARREVYPAVIWGRDPRSELHEYVGGAYARLREVVLAAAQAGDALLVSIG